MQRRKQKRRQRRVAEEKADEETGERGRGECTGENRAEAEEKAKRKAEETAEEEAEEKAQETIAKLALPMRKVCPAKHQRAPKALAREVSASERRATTRRQATRPCLKAMKVTAHAGYKKARAALKDEHRWLWSLPVSSHRS